MLQKATLDFLSRLEKNNNKNWFDANRDAYETAKADFEIFVAHIHGKLTKNEPKMADQKPKDSIFRIFRDVRFSKDKTPYKPHFSAYFSRGGRKAPDAGYYVHIQPGGKSFVAGGLWMPEGPLLKSTRQEIDYNFKEFQSILNKTSFKKLYPKLEGERLKTLPQGYTADNPAIEFLKMKSFVASAKLTDKEIASKDAETVILERFTAMKPLVEFLNRALD
jgi:uncharacterized protein (TIGR02453 family)